MNLANKKFVPIPYLFIQTNKLGEHQVGAESFHFSYLWKKMWFLEKSRLGWEVLHWLSTGLELASWQSLNQHWRLSHLCKQSGVSFVAVTNQNQLFRMFVEIITFTWYSSRIWILAALVVWGNKTDQEIISSCVIHWYSFQKSLVLSSIFVWANWYFGVILLQGAQAKLALTGQKVTQKSTANFNWDETVSYPEGPDLLYHHWIHSFTWIWSSSAGALADCSRSDMAGFVFSENKKIWKLNFKWIGTGTGLDKQEWSRILLSQFTNYRCLIF